MPSRRHVLLTGLGVGACALLAAGGVTLATGWPQSKAPAEQERSYVGPAVQQIADRVPPPPERMMDEDYRAFLKTRELRGTWRWRIAAADAKKSPKALLRAFSCAAGVELMPERAPHLTLLLATAGSDSAKVASKAKSKFPRERPYTLYEGPTCLSPDGLGPDRDYPSGHAARGWTWGLILAELLPDQQSQLLSRAEAYGESRVICGFHSRTGVEAGRNVAMLTVKSMMDDPRFRADLKKASQELAQLRKHGRLPPARLCRAEGTILAAPARGEEGRTP